MLKGVSKSFKDRADGAAFWEAWVGAVLARAGLYTVHHPFLADGLDTHGQTFDLEVYGNHPQAFMDGSGMTDVEVKSLNLSFTGPADYPFDDVMLCSQNSWLRKWPGSYHVCRDFLLVSRHTGNLVWVPCMAPVEMGREVTDSSRGETYKVVVAKKVNLRPLSDFVEAMKDG